MFLLIITIFIWECLPIERTWIYRYKGTLDDWQSKGLAEHFPESIPDNAVKSSFSSSKGYLQGGAHLQIKFQLPSEEIRKIYNEAVKKAEQHHDGGNKCTLINSRKDGLASTMPYILNPKVHDFPIDYRVFVYNAETKSHCNHGNSTGIVISLERNEVIYYAELW